MDQLSNFNPVDPVNPGKKFTITIHIFVFQHSAFSEGRTMKFRTDFWLLLPLLLLGLLTQSGFAKLPPAPPQAELTSEYRQQLLTQLDDEDFQTREQAQAILEQGGRKTVAAFPEFAAQ